MSNREKIIARIRALQSKTQDNGCTEAEALSAAAMVSRMLAEHDVDLTQTELREDGVVRADIENGKGKTGTQQREAFWVSQAIGTFCDCKAFGGYSHIAVDGYTMWRKRVSFIGAPADVETAVWLFKTIRSTMEREWMRYRASRPRGYTHGRTARGVFLNAMALRVRGRLADMRSDREVQATGETNALVVVKSSQINGWLNAQGIHLHSAGRRRVGYDPHAVGAGGAAGDSMGFGKPVSASGPALIGQM
jgi:hypothetical protein